MEAADTVSGLPVRPPADLGAASVPGGPINRPPLRDRLRKSHLLQVLAIYLGASWVVIEVSQTLEEALRLPAWVTPVAVVLLLVGLVVVMATAWVQSRSRVDAGESAVEVPESWELALGDLLRAIRRGELPHLTWSRAILGGVVALSLLFGSAGAFVLLRGGGSDPPPASDLSAAAASAGSVAVLPFENLSEDPEMSYFADGLAVQLLDALIRLEPLRVAARQSSFAFRDSMLTVDEIGRKLHVGTIVDGNVRRSGDSIRINVSLIDVASGFNLWSRTFDEELADVFSIQDAIAREIVRELHGRVLPEDSADVDVARTRSLAAFDHYLKGIDQLRLRLPASLRAAREHFERAIDSDPDYAKAYAGLARAYYHLSNFDAASPTDVYGSRAKEYARHAIALDPLSAEAHAVLGGVYYQVDLQFDAAERELREAIRLNPTSAAAHQWLGEALMVQGHFEEAIAPLERAGDLDPLSPMPEMLRGLGEVANGWPERGLGRWDALLERFPQFFMASINVGWTALALGDGARAIQAWRTGARSYHPDDTLAAAQLSRGMEWLVEAQRDPSRMSAALRYWQDLPEDVTLPYWRYIAYTNLDPAEALSLLRRMQERRDPMFVWAGQSIAWADPALNLGPLAEFLEASGTPPPEGEMYGTLRGLAVDPPGSLPVPR